MVHRRGVLLSPPPGAGLVGCRKIAYVGGVWAPGLAPGLGETGNRSKTKENQIFSKYISLRERERRKKIILLL
jgi:hypothetical protein